MPAIIKAITLTNRSQTRQSDLHSAASRTEQIEYHGCCLKSPRIIGGIRFDFLSRAVADHNKGRPL